MFKRKKKKDEKISKKKLLRAIRAKAETLGDVCRSKAHSDQAIRLEDLLKIVEEL